jgi:hypothetical protein
VRQLLLYQFGPAVDPVHQLKWSVADGLFSCQRAASQSINRAASSVNPIYRCPLAGLSLRRR